MKREEVKELRERMDSLPMNMEGNEVLFAEFGQACATKYIPQLLKHSGLDKEQPVFDLTSCDMCYWNYQQIRMGCADCTNRSAFLNMLSSGASKTAKECYKNIEQE